MSLLVQSPGGGSGGSGAPTGSGYVHITGSAQDGAAQAINLAGGSSYVTGVLPTANQAAQAMGGDSVGTTAASTTIKIQGVQCSPNPVSAGEFFVASSGSVWTPTTISGDISASTTTPGALTVAALTVAAAIAVTGPGFLFAAAQAAPKIGQTASTTGSGAALTVAAQSTTFSGGNGGALNLAAGLGAGTGSAGSINFQIGATTYLTVGSGTLTFASSVSTPGPTISQSSTINATGQSLYLSPQASTNANGTPGGVVVALQSKTGTGSEAYFQVTHAGVSYPLCQVGAHPSGPANGDIWLNPTTGPTSNNYTFLCDGSSLNINAPTSGGNIYISSANGAVNLSVGNASIGAGAPIIGSTLAASVYGVHGVAPVGLSASRAAIASEYCMGTLVVTPSASGLTLSLPAPGSTTTGYTKTVQNPSAFPFTLSIGTGTTVAVAANSKLTYIFSSSGVA